MPIAFGELRLYEAGFRKGIEMQDQQIELPTGLELREFAPVAYYDSHMDAIHVMTHDRSVTEVRIDDTFTLHRCNHKSPYDPEYVGFTLKGIHHLFDRVGLSVSGVLTLAEVLDRVVKHRPVSAVSQAMAYFLFREHESIASALNIEFDSAIEEAA